MLTKLDITGTYNGASAEVALMQWTEQAPRLGPPQRRNEHGPRQQCLPLHSSSFRTMEAAAMGTTSH